MPWLSLEPKAINGLVVAIAVWETAIWGKNTELENWWSYRADLACCSDTLMLVLCPWTRSRTSSREIGVPPWPQSRAGRQIRADRKSVCRERGDAEVG